MLSPRTALLPLVSVLAMAACAGGEDPSAAAYHFLDALRTQDREALRSALTEGARNVYDADGGGLLGSADVESFRVGTTRVDGARAEVAAAFLQETGEEEVDVLLRNEPGGWRVWGMRGEVGGEPFTIDLESPSSGLEVVAESLADELSAQMEEAFAEWQQTIEQGGTPEEIAAQRARFDALTAVSKDEREAAWRLDVDAAGRSALELVRALAGPAGLEVEPGALAQGAPLPPDWSLTGVSRVEAIERVADAAGVHPVWPRAAGISAGEGEPAPEPLTFAAGVRTTAAAFAGPFLVEVVGVDEKSPHAVGSLTLAVRALGLPPATLAYQTRLAELLRLETVRSAAGRVVTDEDVMHMNTPEVRDGYLTYELEKDLRHLLRDVRSLRVAGEVRLSAPARVASVTWNAADTAPVVTELGTLTLEEWGKSLAFHLENEDGDDLEGVEVRTAPRTATGDPLGVLYGGSNGWGSQVRVNLECPEPPAAVDLKICRAETDAFAFALEGIELARWAEQPEQLEPLTFPGEAPLVLAHVETARGSAEWVEVTLRAENSSNKDAVSFVADFVYLDGSGRELEDFPHTLSGEYDLETGEFGPAVPAGETRELTTNAAFVPEGMESIRVRLREVSFPDGSSWPGDAL